MTRAAVERRRRRTPTAVAPTRPAHPQTYYFNICGTSPQRCLPQGYTSRYLYGSAVQMWGSTPTCDVTNPALSCFDVVDNMTMCCTENCEVLGVGTPLWSLIDETNPALGGVMMTHQGVPPATNDPNKCPDNPATGAPFSRSLTYLMRCNPFLPAGDLAIIDAYENTTCQYVIDLQSAAACGCAPNCMGKTCGPDGCGGWCSGSQLAGGCPLGQVCQGSTCCRPDCTNRDCGSDGCGGSCGSCGSDEICSSAQVCLSSAPFIPTTAANYAPDSPGLAGAFFGGVFAALAIAAIAWFFLAGGRAAFDRWRFSGGGDAAGGTQSLIGGTGASSSGVGSGAGATPSLASASRGYGT